MLQGLTKDKVMIACVVGEVTLITEPALKNNIDRIHLIHYIKHDSEKDERTQYYRSFYEETEKTLKGNKIEVVEHCDSETYIFRSMMTQIYKILIEEVDSKRSSVYVNLSGGTPEYAAAAAICSMMFRNVEIFTVSKGYDGRTVDYSQLLENAKKDGKLVGSCSCIGNTYPVEKFPIDRPDENLLKAFRIYSVISDSEVKNSNTTVIRNLIRRNIWLARAPLEEGAAVKGTSVEFELPEKKNACPRRHELEYVSRQRREAVQYYRVYVSSWESKGWIEKIRGTKKYRITEEGRTVLDVFCPSELMDFTAEDIMTQESKFCD